MAEIQLKEHRKYARRKLSLPVQLVIRGALEPIPFNTLDISDGGVFILTDSPLPVSTEVSLVFFLESLGAKVRANGKVVRTCADPSDGGEPEGMAIELREHGRLEWHLLKNLLEAVAAKPEAGE